MVFHSGHVTAGGSICEESLTQTGWSQSTQLLELFVRMKALLMEGGARVDVNLLGQQYGEMEAREAYFRVARQHGWIA